MSEQIYRAEPIEYFPVKPRPDGRFQKRIHARLYYFGAGGDRKEAIAEYDRVKHALYEGRSPSRTPADDRTLTIRDLALRFLDDKLAEVNVNRLSLKWHKQHARALKRFVDFIGPDRTISSITPDDFGAYGRKLSVAVGEHAYNRERSSVNAMFNHAFDCDWIENRMKTGRGFRKVSAATIRGNRQHKLISPATLIALLSAAEPQMQAMILLGINGGFGGTDCGKLLWEHVDVEAKAIRSRRSKSKIVRDTPLWDQTLSAIRRLPGKGAYVFRTKYGGIWNDTAVAHQFAVLRESLGEQIPHVVFSDLRHTFATHAAAAQDYDAKERIMGHKLRGLDDVYVEAVFDDRLRAVADRVRAAMLRPSVGANPSPFPASARSGV